ncbi:hypothetical protein J6590_048508 [Homalodisca vitripennis]|nr:hypothetical protein J6590_048508 [Homalodisca vitripennis]
MTHFPLKKHTNWHSLLTLSHTYIIHTPQARTQSYKGQLSSGPAATDIRSKNCPLTADTKPVRLSSDLMVVRNSTFGTQGPRIEPPQVTGFQSDSLSLTRTHCCLPDKNDPIQSAVMGHEVCITSSPGSPEECVPLSHQSNNILGQPRNWFPYCVPYSAIGYTLDPDHVLRNPSSGVTLLSTSIHCAVKSSLIFAPVDFNFTACRSRELNYRTMMALCLLFPSGTGWCWCYLQLFIIGNSTASCLRQSSSWRPVFQQSRKTLELMSATTRDEIAAGGKSSSPRPRQSKTFKLTPAC